MKVVILAGGFGTRISEESQYKPKPMIEIGEKPILWHIMKEYSFYGFNEFIICACISSTLLKNGLLTISYITATLHLILQPEQMKWPYIISTVSHGRLRSWIRA